MEKEPLLPYFIPSSSSSSSSSSNSTTSPRRKTQHLNQFSSTPPQPLLCTLPENNEITIPILAKSPLTPSVLKDTIIFGPCSPTPNDHSTTVDALTLDSQHHFDQTSKPDCNEPCFSHPWHKSNLHRSKTAPAISVINDFEHPSSIPKPQFGSSSIVLQGLVLLVVYLSLGVIIYSLNRHHFEAAETHPIVDALYFCIVTMCTIGYGDITPKSTLAKLFSVMFVLVGFGFIDILLGGMVSYVLDLQENLLLNAAKGPGEHDLARKYIFDLKKGRMRIRMKVGLALGVVILCIGIGTCVMHFVERLGWLDSFYLSVMSVTTVGYGDHAFKSLAGRLFASVWLLVSTLAVARAFLYLAEARIDKRHRTMAKWVLRQDMTVSEFLSAGIDNNGFVSKSEYVIYKLKEMGKIAEKDISQICNQFDRLDAGNCGKITLADLMQSYH